MKMIIFVHIERSGGTKIHDSMFPHFGEQAIVFTGLVDVAKTLERVLNSGHRNWYLGGHVRFVQLGRFLDTRQPGDVMFSTTRDPIERAVSLYYLCLRSPTWLPALAPIALERGFAEFYAAAVDIGILGGNPQCRFLSGSPDWHETKAKLWRHYDLVGTHRFYRNFLDRLETLLYPHVPDLRIGDERINAAYHDSTGSYWKRRKAVDELVEPALRRRIERDHDSDYALIEYVESREEGVFAHAPHVHPVRAP